MTRFADRSVLITGSTGMAASTARAIGAEGGRIFLASRTEEHARALTEQITDAGGTATYRAADLRQEDEVDAAVAAAFTTFGRIDAVYQVVGISGRRFGDGPLHEASVEGWDAVMAANATSLFLVARAAIRRMLEQDRDADGMRGTLLTMSSALGRHPAPQHFATHAYAASKGAIDALTRSAAAYYAPHGVRINAIAPALVATPMSARAQSDAEILTYLQEKQPLAGGPIDADAVTPVALHLLSRDSRMITGQVIEVDAGWSVSEPRSAPTTD